MSRYLCWWQSCDAHLQSLGISETIAKRVSLFSLLKSDDIQLKELANSLGGVPSVIMPLRRMQRML